MRNRIPIKPLVYQTQPRIEAQAPSQPPLNIKLTLAKQLDQFQIANYNIQPVIIVEFSDPLPCKY